MSERTPSQLISPFHLVAEEMLSKGYHPIPLEYGKKYPSGFEATSWPKYCREAPSEEKLQEWLEYYDVANIGIALGGSVIAIDIDCKNFDELAPLMLELLRLSPARRVGEKGACYLYRPDPNVDPTCYKSENRSWGEMKALGTQIVIPPSIHPKTNEEYYWIDGFCEVEDLPIMTPGEWDAIKNICNKWWEQHTNTTSVRGGTGRLRCANVQLSSGDGSYFRHVYLRDMAFAMACNGHTVEHIAAELRDTSTNKIASIKGDYFATDDDRGQMTPDEFAHKFAQKAITKAKADGKWLDPDIKIRILTAPEPPPPETDGIILSGGPAKDATTPDEVLASTITIRNIWQHPDTVDALHDLIPSGGLMEYITSKLISDQFPSPTLPFSTALSLCSAIATNRISTVNLGTKVMANNYLMAIAPSGKGKSHAKKVVQDFLGSSGPHGQSLKGSSRLLSANTMVTDLGNRPMRRRIDFLDEMDAFWAGITGKGSPTIGTDAIMNDLYTSSNSSYGGDSAKDKNKRVDPIVNPGLNICGFSTPNMIRRAIPTYLFTSGCLPRFMVFVDPAPKVQISRRAFLEAQIKAVPKPSDTTVPPVFISEMEDGTIETPSVRVFKRPDYSSAVMDIIGRFISAPETNSDKTTGIFDTEVLVPTEEAYNLWSFFRTALESLVVSIGDGPDLSATDMDKKSVLDALINRTDDSLLKLCLAYAASQNETAISGDAMLWAIEVYKIQLSCYMTLYQDCFEVHGPVVMSDTTKSYQEKRMDVGFAIQDEFIRHVKTAEQNGDTVVKLINFRRKINMSRKGVSSEMFKKMVEEMIENGDISEGWRLEEYLEPGARSASSAIIFE